MSVVLTIKESHHGLWRICSGPDVLFDRLRFAHAIRLGRAWPARSTTAPAPPPAWK